MEETPHFEAPEPEQKHEAVPGLVRVSKDAYGYIFSFKSEVDAERFVVAFWKEFDRVRGAENEYQMGPRFEDGRLDAGKRILNHCSTQIQNAQVKEQKAGGVTKILYISGQNKAIPFEGTLALSHLVDLPE